MIVTGGFSTGLYDPDGNYQPAYQPQIVRSAPVCQCFRAPCDTTCGLGEKTPMEAPDLVALGQLVNDEFQQWYVLQHPGTQIPTYNQGEIRIPGVTASFNTNVLIIGALVLGAVLLLSSRN